jgi:tripartite-type tricarboxylate transporter receptor subunit TctC
MNSLVVTVMILYRAGPSSLNVPIASEQGFKGLEIGSWVGLFAPGGTPSDIVEAVQRHLAAPLADPKVHDWLTSTGQPPVGNTPGEFREGFRADVARFAKVIERAHIPKLY